MIPRVLHLLSCDDWGGTEVQVAMCVEHSDPRRCVQHVATLEPSGPLTERLRRAGVPTASLAGSFGAVGLSGRLVRLLRDWSIDVLEVYGFRAGLLARLATLPGGKPSLVVGVRGPHFVDAPVDSARSRFALMTERALSRTVSLYVANSQGAADGLRQRGFPARKLRVIPNGVIVPATEPTATSHPPLHVVCVARFAPSKRHDVILHALRRLADTGVDVRCTLIGDGETLPAIRHLAAKLSLSDQVELTGRLTPEQVGPVLASADVFVLVSEREGMPGSVLEAMAHGIAVIGSDVDGTREVVTDQATGLLVRVGDARALGDALAKLAADPSFRSRLGRAAQQMVRERFSIDRLVVRRAEMYEELLRNRGERGRRG